jgi:hypothetical protein
VCVVLLRYQNRKFYSVTHTTANHTEMLISRQTVLFMGFKVYVFYDRHSVRVTLYINMHFIIFKLPVSKIQGRESVAGVGTRYGMNDPGIESQWGRDFSHPSRSVLYCRLQFC